MGYSRCLAVVESADALAELIAQATTESLDTVRSAMHLICAGKPP